LDQEVPVTASGLPVGYGEPVGVLILKNKVSCRLKDIWVPLDYELGNEIMEKAKAVNKAIAKG